MWSSTRLYLYEQINASWKGQLIDKMWPPVPDFPTRLVVSLTSVGVSVISAAAAAVFRRWWWLRPAFEVETGIQSLSQLHSAIVCDTPHVFFTYFHAALYAASYVAGVQATHSTCITGTRPSVRRCLSIRIFELGFFRLLVAPESSVVPIVVYCWLGRRSAIARCLVYASCHCVLPELQCLPWYLAVRWYALETTPSIVACSLKLSNISVSDLDGWPP